MTVGSLIYGILWDVRMKMISSGYSIKEGVDKFLIEERWGVSIGTMSRS